MNSTWLVTPYFFEEPQPALTAAVPEGASFVTNDPGEIADRSVESLARVYAPIAVFVEAEVSAGRLPVSVAGDCSASLPVMGGLQAAGVAPVLVWLDAHGDFNTPETSPSGFLGGMPLAQIVGRGELALPAAAGQSPIPEADVWLVDGRDLDPLEREALESSEVHHVPLSALADLTFDRPVYLHIDNDMVDERDVPANNYATPGGPRLDETLEACRAFAAKNRLVALSLSGWNGQKDTDGRTARACRALLEAALEGQGD